MSSSLSHTTFSIATVSLRHSPYSKVLDLYSKKENFSLSLFSLARSFYILFFLSKLYLKVFVWKCFSVDRKAPSTVSSDFF